jgi:hypothetical protein
MHIILDSNVYISDVRMRGVAFATFLDFVRKTGATLVLPSIVEEEAVATYGRNLKSGAKEVSAVWREYSRYVLSPSVTDTFEMPALDKNKAEFRKIIRNPPRVKTMHVADYSGIAIESAFMRGVDRIRPANDEGEELRDVIIWLFVLEHWKKHQSTSVAFVSSDGGFWLGAKPPKLHPQIEKDTVGTKISVFRNLSAFNAQYSLASRALSAAEATSLALPLTGETQKRIVELCEKTAPLFGQTTFLDPLTQVRDVAIVAAQPKRGNLYDIDTKNGKQFAEIEFAVKLKGARLQSSSFLSTASSAEGFNRFFGFADRYRAPGSIYIEPSFAIPIEIMAEFKLLVSVENGKVMNSDVEGFRIINITNLQNPMVAFRQGYARPTALEAKASPIGSQSPRARRIRRERKKGKRR